MRTFTLVLPKLNTSGAVSLGRSVLSAAEAAAKEEPLPEKIQKPHAKLVSAHKLLLASVAGKVPVADADDSPTAREADSVLDACWASLLGWAAAWAKLPGNSEESRLAARIIQLIFPDGLRFTLIPYKLEWAESEARLQRIRSQKLDEPIVNMGGKKILDTLRHAHRKYGLALGITQPLPETEEVNLREPLDEFVEALRFYVLRVQAHADPDEPETEALAARLLAPVLNWEPQTSSGTSTQPAPEPTLEDQRAEEKPIGDGTSPFLR